jgi:hypothetical protein
MADITECVKRAGELLDAIVEISAAHRSIDEMLTNDYRHLPPQCVPALFREDESGVSESETCNLPAETWQTMFRDQRIWAKNRLGQLADELRIYSSVDGDNYHRLSLLVREEQEALDINDDYGLMGFNTANEIVADVALQMFMEFSDCIKG